MVKNKFTDNLSKENITNSMHKTSKNRWLVISALSFRKIKMKIYPYFFSFKSIHVDEATIEELRACKKTYKINLVIWSFIIFIYLLFLSIFSIHIFDLFSGFFMCTFQTIQLSYSYKMLKYVQEVIKQKERNFS